MSRITLFISLMFLSITTAFAESFSLESPSVTAMSSLDKVYTCDGKNISPGLEWKNPPAETVSYTIIFSDPDAPKGTFYHWILFNIPKSISSLSENVTAFPAGTQVGMNSGGQAQYKGPCPPKGSEHQYIFNIYALDTKLNLPNGADIKAVLDAMQNHVKSTAKLTFKFRH